LTAFRYDAVLSKRAPSPVEPESGLRLVWRHDLSGTDALARILRDERPPLVDVSRIPNARLERATGAMARLGLAPAPSSGADGSRHEPVEPEDVYAVAAEAGYRTALTWSRQVDGTFDASLERAVHDGPAALASSEQDLLRVSRPRGVDSSPSFTQHASDPCVAADLQHLRRTLSRLVSTSVPSAAGTVSLMVVEAIPHGTRHAGL
jgi:hypothetical protein